MNIDSKATIAGVPILTVRDALRRLNHRDQVYVEAFAHHAKTDVQTAQAVVDVLVAEGRLAVATPDGDGDPMHKWLTPGYALANASAMRRVKRATAQRALDGLLQRASELNVDPLACEGVDKIVLFGSFLDVGAAEVGDVDLAVGTYKIRTPTDQEFGVAYARYLQGRRRQPHEPALCFDVLRHLKGGKAVLSPVALEQHERLFATIPHKIIWER